MQYRSLLDFHKKHNTTRELKKTGEIFSAEKTATSLRQSKSYINLSTCLETNGAVQIVRFNFKHVQDITNVTVYS